MNLKSKALALVATLLLTANLYAQTGQITGTVVDAESGETLIGVSVIIDGTIKGSATDIDGNYTIRNVDPGTYTLKVSYLSFSTQLITGVVVEAGETLRLDVAMQPETEMLEEIVVTAEVVLNNEAGLLRQRQKSIAFSDAISSESISRSGAGDAAGAMKKVVGASVVDGKYVYIRGLGDRYSSTHLNGSELPSADPNKKSFQLDLFPSNLLENIVTLKTFTPDKPGNFSGGLVDVTTKDFPEQLSFKVSSSFSYNTESNMQDILLGEYSDSDWRAKDDGLREIPDVFNDPDLEIPSDNAASRDPVLAQELDDLSKSFSQEMTPSDVYVPINQSYSVSLGNQFQLFGRDLGYTASLTYGQSYSAYSDGITGRYELIGDFEGTDNLTAERDFTDIKGSRNADIGALFTLSYRISPNHKISSTYLRTKSGSQEGRYIEGSWIDIQSTATYQTRNLLYAERALSSLQFAGKHYFENLLHTEIDWKVSTAVNTQDEPDLRYFSSQYSLRERNGVVDTLYSNPNSLYNNPSRYFRNLEENNLNLMLDIETPFTSFNGSTGKIKLGGNTVQVERTFNDRRFEYNDEEASFSYDDYNGDPVLFFSDGVGIIDTTNSGRFIFGNFVTDVSAQKNNYTGDKYVNAAYAMIEMPITDKLKFIGGARIEDAQMELVSADTAEPVGKLNNTDILPSANFVYSLSDNMNVRAAYSHTLARPTFRELAPYSSFEFVGDFVFSGNAELKRTLIKNYDLRLELFPTPGEVLAISGFYKQFENPIERVIRTDIGNKSISVQNVPEATVYGLELELRKNLVTFADFLKHFGVASNLSLVQSVVEIPEAEMIVIRAADPNADDTRTLQGQSPYLFNFDISYDNIDIGLISTLNFNKFGDRLSTVTEGAAPDVFERSYNTLDWLIAKSFGKNFEIKFSVKNIMDEKVKFSQEYKGIDYVYQSYSRGRTFSLGLSYKI